MMLKKYFIVILIFVVGVLAGCGEETSTTTTTVITLLPESVSVTVGDTVYFYALIASTEDTLEAVDAEYSVSGDIGTISSTGVFTAETAGTGSVIAVYDSTSTSSTVTVSEGDTSGVLTTIEVTPANTTGRVGETLTFSAIGTNSSGESITFLPEWTMTGDNIGVLTTLDTIATIEVTAEGVAQLNCSSDEVSVFATVTGEGYVVEITAEIDTYVNEGSPTTSYGSSSTLIAGSNGANTYEAYIKFNIDSIPPGTTIDNATLKLYATSTDSIEMDIKRLVTTWDGTNTWNTKPTSVLDVFVNNCTFSSGDNSFDVTSAVQPWVDSGNVYGLAILKKDLSNNGYAIMVSQDDTTVEERRPKLVVEYSL
jgi:hypothetical protein